MAKKLITKKMIKGIDLASNNMYQQVINQINRGASVEPFGIADDEWSRKYNEAVSDIMMMLLLHECGSYSCDARADMVNVMYKYNILTCNTAEQNLRGLDWDSACGCSKVFKFSACLNMGLNHFSISIR